MRHALAAPGLTKLLQRAHAGDIEAENAAHVALHPALRAMAARLMRRHRPFAIWQPTAVVHDAWRKLMARREHSWRDRHHFLRVASRVTYQIVVDWARKESARKRGAGPIAQLPDDGGAERECLSPGDLLDLHDALRRLGERRPRLVQVVHMRFFGGCSMGEIARALDVSLTAVEADWHLARTLLHEMLEPDA